MRSISFHGAAGMVTGSCFLVVEDQTRLLVDCGMFQGDERTENLNQDYLGFDPSAVDGVILTHAHLDHCGRLPLLIKGGFTSPIFMTAATRDLVELALYDAAHIQSKDKENPLYTDVEVTQTLDLVRVVNYHEPFDINQITAEFYDAGHILGSASVVLGGKGVETMVFSGDLGNSPQALIKPTEYIEGVHQTVVMETTYGDRNHREEDALGILADEVKAIGMTGGALLIPTFSLERTQEILHLFDHLKRNGAVDTQLPIFLDSPMAIRATDVFRRFSRLYNTELSTHTRTDDPFEFPGLKMTLRSSESRKIWREYGPKVIIAGSGMMTGGRILAHAKRYLSQPSTRLLFVGYQGNATLGRNIQEGIRRVMIDDTLIPVKATVTSTVALSSHAGQSQLLEWFRTIREVEKLILVHGEETSRKIFEAEVGKHDSGVEILKPKLHETINLTE
jgi:metallo-beta-lactamase family protein